MFLTENGINEKSSIWGIIFSKKNYFSFLLSYILIDIMIANQLEEILIHLINIK